MRRAVWAALLSVGVLATFPEAASAQAAMSPGCQALNNPALDATYVSSGVGPLQFLAGETIHVSATGTLAGGTFTLTVTPDGAPPVVKSAPLAPFDETINYTIPTSGSYTVAWQSLSPTPPGPAWAISCTASPYPLALEAFPRLAHAEAKGGTPAVGIGRAGAGSSRFPLTAGLILGVIVLEIVVTSRWTARRASSED